MNYSGTKKTNTCPWPLLASKDAAFEFTFSLEPVVLISSSNAEFPTWNLPRRPLSGDYIGLSASIFFLPCGWRHDPPLMPRAAYPERLRRL
jgi:hypothetical protein